MPQLTTLAVRLIPQPSALCARMRRSTVRPIQSLPDTSTHEVNLCGRSCSSPLRRTVGRWLVQSGNSLYLIGRVLNHSKPSTTAVYARFGQDQVRGALEQHGG